MISLVKQEANRTMCRYINESLVSQRLGTITAFEINSNATWNHRETQSEVEVSIIEKQK